MRHVGGIRATLGALRALVWKELLVEARSREVLVSGAVFALLVLVTFSLALDQRPEEAASVAPGVLWVSVTFAAVLGLGRAFARERDRRTLEGLLLAPVDASVLYLAKAGANLAGMAAVEAVAVPALLVLFNLRVDLPGVLLALALGSVGFTSVGTLVAAVAAHTRAREVLLPVLLLPVQVPVVLGTVKSLGAAIRVPGGEISEAANWIGLLLAFDVLFLGLSVLLFDYAIAGD